MKSTLNILLAVTAAFSISAAQAQTATATPSASVVGAAGKVPGKGAGAGGVATVTAVIESIDPATRTVVLRGPQGRTLPVVADERIKNFENMKVGDKVVAQYARALTLELKKGGDGIREMVQREGAAVNQAGQAAGASAMRQTTILANVWSIDRKNNVVALRGPKGNIVDVEVANPKIMQEIKVGDQVEAQYTEAALLGVTRLAK
jgi:hypothetical protein